MLFTLGPGTVEKNRSIKPCSISNSSTLLLVPGWYLCFFGLEFFLIVELMILMLQLLLGLVKKLKIEYEHLGDVVVVYALQSTSILGVKKFPHADVNDQFYLKK